MKFQESQAKKASAENKLAVAANELLIARIEINSARADYLAKIAKARSDKNEATYNYQDALGNVAKLKNELRNIQIRSSFYTIKAPQSGIIVKAIKAGIGETIKEGDAVVMIMPEKHTLAVELYVSAYDVPLLSRGRKVRLQFDGWPAMVFSGWPNVSVGTFGGIISVIDFVNSKEGKYRILVTEDKKDEPWPPQLRMGSGVYGWAMLDEVPVWFELWRQFNGFPPSLNKAPDDDFKDGKKNVKIGEKK